MSRGIVRRLSAQAQIPWSLWERWPISPPSWRVELCLRQPTVDSVSRPLEVTGVVYSSWLYPLQMMETQPKMRRKRLRIYWFIYLKIMESVSNKTGSKRLSGSQTSIGLSSTLYSQFCLALFYVAFILGSVSFPKLAEVPPGHPRIILSV